MLKIIKRLLQDQTDDKRELIRLRHELRIERMKLSTAKIKLRACQVAELSCTCGRESSESVAMAGSGK